MYESDSLEVWNLTAGGAAYLGAQRIFNVVGQVKNASGGSELTYSLNGNAPRPVLLGGSRRNIAPNHFNIDTINVGDLQEENDLELWVRSGERVSRSHIRFTTRSPMDRESRFDLDFDGVRNAEEIGQCIDGRWEVGIDEDGRPCLEIRPENAGYDRLFGLGRHDWTNGYRVQMDFRVTKWTNPDYFNVGLLFKWNPHDQGDGTVLPTNWNSGLAYYAAQCPGLRLRYGVNVHVDPPGRKVGSYVLQEKSVCPWKYWAGLAQNRFLPLGRRPLTQLKLGALYTLDLVIDPRAYHLEIHREGRRQPLVELYIADPPEMLPTGCVGLIAGNCAARFYSFSVSPV